MADFRDVVNSRFGTPDKFLLQGTAAQLIKPKFFKLSNGQDKTELEAEDGQTAVSLLGTSVVSNLIFPAGKYINYDGVEINYEGLRIDTVVYNVTQQKNIVITPIVGRQGTIKEYVSEGDYLISIEGLISGETTEKAEQVETGTGAASGAILGIKDIGNKYPERDVARFVKLMKVPDTLKIISDFLGRLDVSEVVVDSYDLTVDKGRNNTQLFSLRLISDTPIQLQ